MTSFEPEADTSILDHDKRSIRLENDYTDDELLIELRRRGRLARAEGVSRVSMRHVEAGLELEY